MISKTTVLKTGVCHARFEGLAVVQLNRQLRPGRDTFSAHKDHIAFLSKVKRGRDSIVSIATRYGLEGPGIESWWR